MKYSKTCDTCKYYCEGDSYVSSHCTLHNPDNRYVDIDFCCKYNDLYDDLYSRGKPKTIKEAIIKYNIPKDIFLKYAEKGENMKMFGVPIPKLSKEELIAIIAFLSFEKETNNELEK